ncbi:chloroplast 50S ribosomal protein 17 [Tribonema minus]|uniref:Chloroplast 50S ribosomal protein 17 n=1 Tax=Tribonema minus TaxID=303371 RepID=A0A835Z8L6_9STRA|nr:chloroplast 50S ribosomal protein 17 [Tribonema minus]
MRKQLLKGGLSRMGRGTAHRIAMLKNMVTSLITHERIKTTVPKAKNLKVLADQMVTHAKTGTLHSRRLAQSTIQDKGALDKLFKVLGPRYEERPGGYTRILKLATPRLGDKADMCLIEFVDRQGELRPARPVGKDKEPFMLPMLLGERRGAQS